MKFGMQVGFSPSEIVLNGNPTPLPKGGGAPNFRPISVVAKCLDGSKMSVGREVSFKPSNMLDGDVPSFTSPKRGRAPNFRPMFLLRPNGWMDQDATWYGSRPPPMPCCVRRGRSFPFPSAKGAQQPPLFSSYLLWSRLHISATAELLYIISDHSCKEPEVVASGYMKNLASNGIVK